MSLETCLAADDALRQSKVDSCILMATKRDPFRLNEMTTEDRLIRPQLAAQRDLSTMSAAKFGESVQGGQPD